MKAEHAVCMELTRVEGVDFYFLGKRKFEFLMVKLLRVYGECLGTKSR